jgi:hypothetical protein
MSLLTVLLILAVFGIVFLLVLVVVIRTEIARAERAVPDHAGDEASTE